MLSWLEGAVGTVAGFFGKAFNFVGNAIRDAILAVFHFVTGIFDNVGAAWTWVVNGVSWFLTHAGDWAASVFGTLGHILGTVVPNAIGVALSEAVSWAGRELGKAAKALEGLVSTAVRNLMTSIHAIEHTLGSAASSLLHDVVQLWRWFETGAREAVDLVLHPERLLLAIVNGVGLAAWWVIVHAILPIVVKILRDSRSLVGHLLGDLESILADLLH